MSKRCSAEFFGTIWLTFGGCSTAVLAAAFPNLGIGLTGVSFAFGLNVLTMASRHDREVRGRNTNQVIQRKAATDCNMYESSSSFLSRRTQNHEEEKQGENNFGDDRCSHCVTAKGMLAKAV